MGSTRLVWTQCEAEARVTEARLEAEPRLTPASSRCGNMGGQPELLLQHTGGLEQDTGDCCPATVLRDAAVI